MDVPGNMVYKESRFTIAGADIFSNPLIFLAEFYLLFAIYVNLLELVLKDHFIGWIFCFSNLVYWMV